MKTAFLVIDVQNDFLPGGLLAVARGDEVIEPIKQLLKLDFDYKIASQDFHPPGHSSFASTWKKIGKEGILKPNLTQELWPDHCIQGTYGAEISARLSFAFDLIVQKGTDREIDSYSAFFDNEKKRKTPLASFLQQNKVERLYIAGLTTDYCVFYTALDAKDLGFDVYVVIDACRPVSPDTEEEACRKMKEKGIHFVTAEHCRVHLMSRKAKGDGSTL
jgi:nicotinamidase/pyrazinamidase